MDDGLLLTLSLDGVAEGSAEEKRAPDAIIAGLVALGPLPLGRLTAELAALLRQAEAAVRRLS